jgi:pimeloyl-ACP methyl ester carboxylesterase
LSADGVPVLLLHGGFTNCDGLLGVLAPLGKTYRVVYESLPAGQLAVVPGASHLVHYEKPELVVHLVADFLGTDGTVTMMPVRRA